MCVLCHRRPGNYDDLQLVGGRRRRWVRAGAPDDDAHVKQKPSAHWSRRRGRGGTRRLRRVPDGPGVAAAAEESPHAGRRRKRIRVDSVPRVGGWVGKWLAAGRVALFCTSVRRGRSAPALCARGTPRSNCMYIYRYLYIFVLRSSIYIYIYARACVCIRYFTSIHTRQPPLDAYP